MRFLTLFALTLFVFSSASAKEFKISPAIFRGNSVQFLKFEGPGQFDSYLAMNIPFNPVAQVYNQLQRKVQKPLINRGEAHITVITPVEYWNILRPRGITMKEINQIAENFHIQQSRFNILCLGQGNAMIDNQMQSTYFIVVNSADLINLRKIIHTLYVRKGGLAKEFDPKRYFPHITLGFTKVDLHESNGVIKDLRSCVGRISSTNIH